jgi:hypothetical protein
MLQRAKQPAWRVKDPRIAARPFEGIPVKIPAVNAKGLVD